MPARVTPTGLFFSAFWVSRHDHAVGDARSPHWHARAVVEAAHHLTFWTLLQLIRWKMQACLDEGMIEHAVERDRKSTRLNSSHLGISYAVFCLKKKKIHENEQVYSRSYFAFRILLTLSLS